MEIFFVAALALVASLNRTRLAPIFVGAYLTLTGTAPVLSGLLPFGGASLAVVLIVAALATLGVASALRYFSDSDGSAALRM